jgi:hypothetical protein
MCCSAKENNCGDDREAMSDTSPQNQRALQHNAPKAPPRQPKGGELLCEVHPRLGSGASESKEVPDMSLTIFGTMWAADGPVVQRHNPIEYEVRGLPSGHERVLIGQNLDVQPIRWRVLRTRDGVREWEEEDYETPGAALAALQAEFGDQ